MKKILLVGSGNVATHLAQNIDNKKYIINQIFSRCESNAKNLIELLKCHWTNDPKKIINSDLTIIAVNDDKIKDVISLLPDIPTVHTSGNTDISVLKGYFNNYGVLYPLQTFKKSLASNLSQTPFLIEGNNKKFEKSIFELASSFSKNVTIVNSCTRKNIHLAAVFACNFSNHMLVLSKEIAEKSDFDFSLLLPLIKKTLSQIDNEPEKLQTGPAIRKDLNIMNSHLERIKNKDLKKIYELISNSIIKSHHGNN